METYDVMDCENVGFQCYRSQVEDLFNGNDQIFAQRIADTLKRRFSMYGSKYYLYASPETFESMFTVGDDSLIPVVSDTIQNVKSNNRKSLDELLKLNNVRLEGFGEMVRYYVDFTEAMLEAVFDMRIGFYKSGYISGCSIQGQRISNSRASRMLGQKIFYDAKAGRWMQKTSMGTRDLCPELAAALKT